MDFFYMLLAGIFFGFLLSVSGATDYTVIQGMFLFEDGQLYGILAFAVGVSLPGLWWLKRKGKAASGEPLKFKIRPAHKGNVVGGILFGMGWAITGMCPGPIFVNLGEGKLYAIGALGGALLGAYVFGAFYPRWVQRLGLPPLGVPTRTDG